MRSVAVSALFALAAVQQAAASSGDWNQCSTLSTPQQADNQCTNDMKTGMDVSTANLPQGSCGSYNNLDLTGLSYGSWSGSKRSLFSRNGGASDNCLMGQASKNSGPSISCGSGIPKQQASVTNMKVLCDKDTDVQFVHSYAGSDQTCSYTKSLKAGTVNSVDNTQCGGSTAVTCQLPDTSKEENCNVGFQSLSFDCTPGQQQSSSSSPSQAPSSSASSPPASYPVTTPVGTAPGMSLTPIFPIPSGSISSSVPVVPFKNATTPVVPIVPATSSPSQVASSSVPASSVPSAPVSSPATSAPSQVASSSVPVSSAPSAPASSPAPSVPATSSPSQVATSSSPPESTVAEVTSEIVYTTITSCPVTNTKTYGSTTSVEVTTSISTVLITSTKTICTRCVAPQMTSSVPAPPASSPVQVGSTVPAVPVSSPPAPPASSPAQVGSTVPAVPVSSPPAPPASSPAQVGSTVPAVPVSSPAPPASSPVQVASTVPAVPVSSAPAPPQTTQEVVTTAIVYTTLTTCPVTNTVTPPGGTPIQQVTTTISTITSTSISTICTKCVAPVASTPAAPPVSSGPVQQATSVAPPASSSPAVVASSAPPAPVAPSVLPSCVKTWVSITKCKDNSDYNCYCQDDTFTQNVYECISAWEQDQAQQQAAFSYYAGICAKQVPAHPAIVTAVPSTITLVPQPSTTTITSSSSLYVVIGSAAPAAPAVTSGPAAPVAAGVTSAPAASAGSAAPAGTPAPAAATLPPTTISISTTVTLPCSAAGLANQLTDGQVQASGSMAPGCTTTSLLQTTVTVPQIAFTTGASSSVGLQAGPAPAQAAATAPAGGIPGVAAGSSSASVPKNTGTTAPFTGAAVKAGPSSVIAVIVGAVAMALFA